MITVGEARAVARKKLEARLGEWAGLVTAGEPSPAVSIALRPPSERQMLADEAAAETWAREWAALQPADGVEVDWEVRAWRSIGRQRVPVRVRLADADATASFAGGAAQADWSRLRERAERIATRFGASEAVSSVVRRRARDLLALEEGRFAQVVDVAAWIIDHPVTGYRPRQVPVRGVDSKWLGRHRQRVTDLVSAVTGSADLGLLEADPLVRLRILDDALAVGGPTDIAAPAAQLADLPLRPQGVFIMENRETVLAMPRWPGAVAIHGSGYAVSVVAALPWVRSARVLYWGDLDSNGFAILGHLRAGLPDAVSVLMDSRTLYAHRDLWVAESVPVRGELPELTYTETAALAALRDEGDVRLEQERVPWAYALAELRAAWGAGSSPGWSGRQQGGAGESARGGRGAAVGVEAVARLDDGPDRLGAGQGGLQGEAGAEPVQPEPREEPRREAGERFVGGLIAGDEE